MNDVVNYFNKNSFLFLLTVGAVLSYVVRALLENPENPLHGSVLAMFFCFLCLYVYYYKVKQDNSGMHNPDNCYYMGLLFTLLSLIYSLITLFLLNSDSGDVARRTHNLIGSFGIALISTLFGILFRILLLQSPVAGSDSKRHSPSDTMLKSNEQMEKLWLQAHANLNEAAFKLRMELTQTIADMNVFRSATIQAANKTVQELSKACFEMTRQMEKSVGEQTNILSTLSDTVVAKLTESVGGITASVKNIKKPLDDLVDLQIKQAQNIHDSSGKITNSGEMLVASIDSLNSSLQQSVTFFAGIENEIEQSAKVLTVATEKISRSLTDAAEVTPQYTRQFQELITVLRGEAEQWQSMTGKVRTSLVQAIEKLTEVMKGGS